MYHKLAYSWSGPKALRLRDVGIDTYEQTNLLYNWLIHQLVIGKQQFKAAAKETVRALNNCGFINKTEIDMYKGTNRGKSLKTKDNYLPIIHWEM